MNKGIEKTLRSQQDNINKWIMQLKNGNSAFQRYLRETKPLSYTADFK